MRIKWEISWFVIILFNVICYATNKINSSVAFNTEVIEQGRLVSKQSLTTHIGGVIRNDTWGIYNDFNIVSPLQYKNLFPNRWSIYGGFLKKLTEHFTFDLGVKYTFLQRFGFEPLHQWMKYYAGIRSNLLMTPKFYLSWDHKRRQWSVETSFKYDFDIFDCKDCKLSWETKFGFLKGRKPYGRRQGFIQRKYKYYYIEIELLLKRRFKDAMDFYIGPKFAYNSGNKKYRTIVNTATHHSRFCSLCFGLELSF